MNKEETEISRLNQPGGSAVSIGISYYHQASIKTMEANRMN